MHTLSSKMQKLLSQCKESVNNQNGHRSTITVPAKHAPHPIPEGMEDAICPITGLSHDGREARLSRATAAAMAAMEADPDIMEENLARATWSPNMLLPAEEVQAAAPRPEFVPLNVRNGAHKASAETRRLVRSVGLPKLRVFTETFYAKCFADPHIDRFLRSHDDPHGERFSLWVAEKFGDGTPWTEERMARPQDLMQIGRHMHEVAFDRSSAHFAAWHSPKREPHKRGERFELDDARVWMRLHFWAAREVGLFDPQYASFMDYYIRFIGHFISIYAPRASLFTRESARWSADPRNIARYLEARSMMVDVVGKPLEAALATLPKNERDYTGSRHSNPSWPYQTAM